MSAEEEAADPVLIDRSLSLESNGTGFSDKPSPDSMAHADWEGDSCVAANEFIVFAKSPFAGNPDEDKCTLKRGDRVRVIEKTNSAWWWVSIGDQLGWAPSNHLCSEEELKDITADLWQDDEYFSSYGPLKLHREMLGDIARTSSYQRAVQSCASYIEGKVVLDVGCGTGILSMFCAREGRARKVYGVEASDASERAEEVVRSNKLDDRVVLINGKVEDIDLPEQVDLIISEWMGTLLLFELMLESVLRARDRFLKPGERT